MLTTARVEEEDIERQEPVVGTLDNSSCPNDEDYKVYLVRTTRSGRSTLERTFTCGSLTHRYLDEAAPGVEEREEYIARTRQRHDRGAIFLLLIALALPVYASIVALVHGISHDSSSEIVWSIFFFAIPAATVFCYVLATNEATAEAMSPWFRVCGLFMTPMLVALGIVLISVVLIEIMVESVKSGDANWVPITVMLIAAIFLCRLSYLRDALARARSTHGTSETSGAILSGTKRVRAKFFRFEEPLAGEHIAPNTGERSANNVLQNTHIAPNAGEHTANSVLQNTEGVSETPLTERSLDTSLSGEALSTTPAPHPPNNINYSGVEMAPVCTITREFTPQEVCEHRVNHVVDQNDRVNHMVDQDQGLDSMEAGQPRIDVSSSSGEHVPAKEGDEEEYTLSEGASTLSTCIICLDNYRGGEELVQIPCGHAFHGLCLAKWIDRRQNCPLCKVSFLA